MVGRLYWPDPATKKDPLKRWARQDRCFFGYGACHILAGTFLKRYPNQGWNAFWIQPIERFFGNHIFVAKDTLSFDHHCYCRKDRLLTHFLTGWKEKYPGWDYHLKEVDFDLLDTESLNQRKMLGADQYLHNAEKRAESFLHRYPLPTSLEAEPR